MALTDWRIFALLSAVFAALTAIFGKLGVENLNSNLATFIRTGIVMVFAGIIVSMRGEWKLPSKMDPLSIVFLVLSGLATGASWLFYYRALQLGPASKVAPIDKLSVAFVILLAAIFLGEKITLKVFIGGLLIVAGSVVMVL